MNQRVQLPMDQFINQQHGDENDKIQGKEFVSLQVGQHLQFLSAPSLCAKLR